MLLAHYPKATWMLLIHYLDATWMLLIGRHHHLLRLAPDWLTQLRARHQPTSATHGLLWVAEATTTSATTSTTWRLARGRLLAPWRRPRWGGRGTRARDPHHWKWSRQRGHSFPMAPWDVHFHYTMTTAIQMIENPRFHIHFLASFSTSYSQWLRWLRWLRSFRWLIDWLIYVGDTTAQLWNWNRWPSIQAQAPSGGDMLPRNGQLLPTPYLDPTWPWLGG